ncbi:type II secretion system F family protein [Schlesneria sp. DSM 10557]|uniref:type II secretion system F family protein n=1 Tax=Schlesneria sp. DSM 10557 TaxID=3044399 RepID=UPI0035A0971A
MTQSSSSLDDLILLNREIAALVKAGIPLELGLKGLAGNVGTRLGGLSERLSKRMAEGTSLPDALALEGPAVSPVYTAVMEAGLSSGRLPDALESMAASGQVMQETRQRIRLAIIYPLFCGVISYGLLAGFLTFFLPHLLRGIEGLGLPYLWPIEGLKFLDQHKTYVTLVIPAVVLAVVVVTALLRKNVTRGLWRWMTSFRWVPGVTSIRQSQNWAQFTELLAMQLEHAAPLPRAFRLAADSVDHTGWHQESRMVCDKLELGIPLPLALESSRLLPPLARWMISTAERQGTLIPTLRQLSEMYRRRALLQAARLKTWLPVMITIGVTGVIGLAYGLLCFIPMRALLIGLMQE